MSREAKRLGRLTYERCRALLNGRKAVRIANNTWLTACASDCRYGLPADRYEVALHGHVILTFRSDGGVILSSCGFRTVTTKQRLNALGPCRVWAERGEWRCAVSTDETGSPVAFRDDMMVGGDALEAALRYDAAGTDWLPETRAARAALHDYLADRAAR